MRVSRQINAILTDTYTYKKDMIDELENAVTPVKTGVQIYYFGNSSRGATMYY